MRSWKNLPIAGVSTIPELLEGFSFCAVRGAKADGRTIYRQALERGAVAVVSDDPNLALPEAVPHLVCANAYHAWEFSVRPLRIPGAGLRLHAVTGTNGENHHGLSSSAADSGNRTGSLRSDLHHRIRFRRRLSASESARTTPDAMAFQRIMTKMAENGCSDVVLEASSHGLHQKRMGTAQFETAIFTNLTGDHLDYHHTMEAYYQAKKILFSEQLSEHGHAVVNLDDPWGVRLAEELRKEERSRSRSPHKARPTAGSVRSASPPTARVPAFLERRGRAGDPHQSDRIAQSLQSGFGRGGGSGAGSAPDELKRVLSEPIAVPGRLESFALPNGSSAFVDYAHTDDALKRVLSALRRSAGAVLLRFSAAEGIATAPSAPAWRRSAADSPISPF